MNNLFQVQKASLVFERLCALMLSLISIWGVWASWGEGSIVYWAVFIISLASFVISTIAFFEVESQDNIETGGFFRVMRFWAMLSKTPLVLTKNTYSNMLEKIKKVPESDALDFLSRHDPKCISEQSAQFFIQNRSASWKDKLRPHSVIPFNTLGFFSPKPPEWYDKNAAAQIECVIKNPPRVILEDMSPYKKITSVFFCALTCVLLYSWWSTPLSALSNSLFTLSILSAFSASVWRAAITESFLHALGVSTLVTLEVKRSFHGSVIGWEADYAWHEQTVTQKHMNKIKSLFSQKTKITKLLTKQSNLEVTPEAIERDLRALGLWQKAEALRLKTSLGDIPALCDNKVEKSRKRKM